MSKAPKIKVKIQPAVVMEAEVARKIRQHSRTSMKAEVCGVLIGETSDERTLVEACIAGVNAAQGGAHVTFTQDTWEHIYQIKDRQYPDSKIVGWYHSHPGFGVFLSEHDLFIHENFFSSPQQIAWVYDPHTDEEGCFGWVSGKIEKLSGVRFGYSQSVELTGPQGNEDEAAADEDAEDHGFMLGGPPGKKGRAGPAPEPVWVTWASRILGYLAVAALGFGLGYMFFEYRYAPVLETYQQILRHPIEACQQLLQPYLQPPGAVAPEPQNPPPAAQQEKPPADKGKNGKR
ncbi:MAG: Mov34/MPN/PAD-1 family protein [Acidobacteriia bacterium]|nr:Mov34/MPN/PAD-1 family protein [Terriglobia bacterium]